MRIKTCTIDQLGPENEYITLLCYLSKKKKVKSEFKLIQNSI